MSKQNSKLFWGTSGTYFLRLIPGKNGIVTGGNSNVLGKNMLKSMGISTKTPWTGYQAQHIIPAELSSHPILNKIGIDLDDASNGLFLQTPKKNNISTQTRHRGYHSIYNSFVKQKLDNMDIKKDTVYLQKEVKLLQLTLKKMQQSGIVIYPNQGGSLNLLEKTYNRFYNKYSYKK